ncbi:MAG TPA: acyl-CoA dehydrogenase family protein [Acetobacteraceae bacterium]|nr:acyl-CoA dehydrogenase family protein [Acetobacteraceae bacterium]
MPESASSYIAAARALAPQIHELADAIEQSRRLPPTLVDAMARAGLFRLWIPRSLGGEETDPMTLLRVVEEIAGADGAAGWCVALIGEYGVFGGYLPSEVAHEIYGSDPNVRTAGQLRPAGEARLVDGGYRVTGRWQFGSGCQHAHWIVGGCRIFDGAGPCLKPDGTAISRLLFFPAADCEIIDTWHTIGLRGTGSHDYAVSDVFVPTARSLSFQEPPVEQGPLYAMPTVALFGTALAAVSLGIARHAIDILLAVVPTRKTGRSRGGGLRDEATVQTGLGHAEALLRSGRAFLYAALQDAWKSALAGQTLSVAQRAELWLASTQAANAAKQATELMFSAGSSASPFASFGLERCVRDIHASAQHICVAPANYQVAGQAFLGLDMRASVLLSSDDRGTH